MRNRINNSECGPFSRSAKLTGLLILISIQTGKNLKALNQM